METAQLSANAPAFVPNVSVAGSGDGDIRGRDGGPRLRGQPTSRARNQAAGRAPYSTNAPDIQHTPHGQPGRSGHPARRQRPPPDNVSYPTAADRPQPHHAEGPADLPSSSCQETLPDTGDGGPSTHSRPRGSRHGRGRGRGPACCPTTQFAAHHAEGRGRLGDRWRQEPPAGQDVQLHSDHAGLPSAEGPSLSYRPDRNLGAYDSGYPSYGAESGSATWQGAGQTDEGVASAAPGPSGRSSRGSRSAQRGERGRGSHGRGRGGCGNLDRNWLPDGSSASGGGRGDRNGGGPCDGGAEGFHAGEDAGHLGPNDQPTFGGRGRHGGAPRGVGGGGRGGYGGYGRGAAFGRSGSRAGRAAHEQHADDTAAAAAAAGTLAGTAAAGSDGDGDSDSDGGRLTCVICCEEVTAVAVGACGHSHTCARCCLRLRLCYRDLRCPLCKAVNDEVVVTRPPLPPGASFESLAGTLTQREALWQQARWARGVLVCDSPTGHAGAGGAPRRGRLLHRSLLSMTSQSCCVCDRQGHRPFGSMKLLLGHLRSAHDRTLCEVCLGAGLKFPLEYPALDAAGLAAHMAADHPRCEYCDLAFYGRDELYSHMTQRHFTCHVCSRAGRHHLYFPDAEVLMVHLREDHHTCDHPDCVGCMIAFTTRDELTAHIRDQHSSYMPRWDQSRARPLLLDFITPRGPAAAAALAGAAGGAGAGSERYGSGDRQRGRGRGRRGRIVDAMDGPTTAAATSALPAGARRGGGPGVLEDPEAFPSLGGGAPAPPQQAPPAGLGEVHETEGGLAVIDDDLGMGLVGPGRGGPTRQGTERRGGGGGGGSGTGTAATAGAAAGAPGAGGPVRLAGVWAGRTPGSGTFGEDFPELSTGPGGSGGPRSAWGWGAPAPAARPASTSPPSVSAGGGLRKVTVKCPCGRRVDHLALRPDEKAPALPCDRECTAQQRRSQLADAFSMPLSDSHVSYFDRHRTPNYSVELVQAAQAAGVDWVATVERDLSRFLADTSARRTSLAPGMSQAQRRLVHMLAQHYGLTSHSLGQGAARAVQVIRGAASGVPTRLLSGVAAATGPEELARMAGSAAGGGGGPSGGSWALRLVDLAPGANVHHYLRAWEGEYTLSPAPGSGPSSSPSSLLLTFTREAPFRDCCATLAGGVRGVFRTIVERDRDRMSPPPTAAPAAPPAPPGWQVLRSKPAPAAAAAPVRSNVQGQGPAAGGSAGASAVTAAVAPSGRKGNTSAAVRAALAADAWEWGDEGTGARGDSSLPSGQACKPAPAASVADPVGGVASSEPRLPGRGPPLDLARDTLWSALRADGVLEDDEEEKRSREGEEEEKEGEAGEAVRGAGEGTAWDEGSGAAGGMKGGARTGSRGTAAAGEEGPNAGSEAWDEDGDG